MSLFLTPDELTEWTGYTRREDIIRQLAQYQADGPRFHFDVDHMTGWPRVLRTVIDPPSYDAWKYQIGTVYLIAASGTGRVKIGFTRNVERRYRALQLANAVELELIATKTTLRAEEAYLHRTHKARCVHGEWYRDCQPIRREFPA